MFMTIGPTHEIVDLGRAPKFWDLFLQVNCDVGLGSVCRHVVQSANGVGGER
jgi:hypothetical protein